MKQTPPQWAIKQHLENSPKCEWLCTHSNLNNLGEVKTPPKTPSTTSKPVEETDCYCVCHSPVSSCAYCEHCKGINEVGAVHNPVLKALIDKQVLEGRIDTADYLVKRFVDVYHEGKFIEFVASYIDALQTNNKEEEV